MRKQSSWKRFKLWILSLLSPRMRASLEQLQVALPVRFRRLRRSLSGASGQGADAMPVVRFGVAGRQCWFGYYDVTPFNSNGSRLLAMVGDRWCRTPQPGDKVQVGYFDLADPERFHPIDETTTWCWQQGCRLRWWPSTDGRAERMSYNRLVDNHYGAVVRGVSQESDFEEYDCPLYDIHPNGRDGLSLNFSRLHRLRKGYGYVNLPDETADHPCPDYDGVWQFEFATRERQLLTSLQALAGFEPQESMRGAEHYVNHLAYSPGGKRFIFLHLWMLGSKRHSRLLVCDHGGKNLEVVHDRGIVSHFTWRGDDKILATVNNRGNCAYYLFDLVSGTKSKIGSDDLVRDGHPSYGADSETVLTDTYPDAFGEQRLMLFHPNSGVSDLGRYYAPSKFRGEWRCDLHPRWDNSGRKVAIDSTHDGWRSIYVIDAV